MHDPIKLPVGHPLVKRLLRATFPDYRGRRIYLRAATHPVDVRSYWDEGSRSYFVAVDLRTMRVVAVPQNGTPWDGGPIAPTGVVVGPGAAIVERAHRGTWEAIYVHVAPQTALPASLAQAAGLMSWPPVASGGAA